VRSPLWLRRLAVNPATVSAYPEIGIEQKLARDLTDDEVRAIAAYHGRRSKLKQLDEAWSASGRAIRSRGKGSSRWPGSPGLGSGSRHPAAARLFVGSTACAAGSRIVSGEMMATTGSVRKATTTKSRSVGRP
jgi:hypothetical protein